VTEIALIGKEFWPRFEIRTFYTGQTQDKSSVFAREMDWDWNLSTRPDPENGTPALAYRGRGRSVRFIRIVCKEAGAKAALAEIVVRGAKAAAP
jgi:hypothetical protein